MSSAYALPLNGSRKLDLREKTSGSIKSLMLSILMISMSLSTGIIEVNQPTSDLEKSPAEFDIPGISEKLSELIMPIAKVLWPADDTGELNPDESQSSMTGARSSPPILSLSTSSVALIYGENVNPTITPSNSGGAVTSWSISPTHFQVVCPSVLAMELFGAILLHYLVQQITQLLELTLLAVIL